MQQPIKLTGVRQNNLKNIDVEFPPKQLTVITGVSGSGKSSLAFDTLYAEGQRRYVESLSTYTRQFLDKMPKPELDQIQNIPPSIALEQKNHVLNSRSSVGTQTEIVDYLRILFARIGTTFCSECGTRIEKLSAEIIQKWALEWLPGKKVAVATKLLQEDKTEKQPVKKATKKLKKPATSLLTVLSEQGFSRILIAQPKKTPQVVALEDLKELFGEKLENLNPELVYVVIDRFKTAKDETKDRDFQSRLLGSIEQAIAIGRGTLHFFDLDSTETKSFDNRFACKKCGKEHREPEPNLFSFNSPLGACAQCSGFGFNLELDENLIVPDPNKTIKNGAIDPFSKPSFSEWQTDMFRFCERKGISVGKRYRELTASQKSLLWDGSPDDKTFTGIRSCFEELKRWKYKLHIRVFIRRYQTQSLCIKCKGARLSIEALSVKIQELNISEVQDLSIQEATAWFDSLILNENQKKIAQDIFVQVKRRLEFLDEVGVGYLTLSRPAKTLSGGEFQRINIATQLGNGLCGTLYVLDEPSIGLHAADTDRLIRVLHRLRDQGNTVVVVEHDLEVMRNADHLIEMGPYAGRRGGEIVATGKLEDFKKVTASLTGKYLSGAFNLKRTRPARGPSKRQIQIIGASENNLQSIDIDIPLDRFVVVTGVSGSGKSTLVHKTLHHALSKLFYHTTESMGKFEKLYGAEQVAGVVLLDQSSIGRNSRSNPATYLKAWDEVRRIYANQALSLRRGYTPQYFSFNVDGGRCPVCKGEGEITLDMHFMAEIKLPCEECDSKRFKKKIFDVTYRGRDIYQLLSMTIDEAYELFRDNPVLSKKFGILREVGLGYLQVGQSATTLSGGESQRLKIAATLDEKKVENMLYIFDEPTTGLHLDDIKKLLEVIQDLVHARHSVVMIEHHLDVIAQSDWVIDLGPGGGKNGGSLLFAGPPYELFNHETSLTAKMLRDQGYHFIENDPRT